MVGSRFTKLSESRYALIEGEALAIVHALDKAKFFVLGCRDLTIAVDHKPLLGVFSDRSLDMPNGRLRDLKEKTLRYHFTMLHIPGMKNKAADALSRHPSSQPDNDVNTDNIASITDLTSTGNHHFISGIFSVEAVNTLASFQAVTWDMVKKATNSDQHMCDLLDHIEEGFPVSTRDLPSALRSFHQYHEDLFVVDGVALYGDRIIIPPSLRAKILDILHSAHQGYPQCFLALSPLSSGQASRLP